MSKIDYDRQEAECDQRQSASPLALLWRFRLTTGGALTWHGTRKELVRSKLPSDARSAATMVDAASFLFERKDVAIRASNGMVPPKKPVQT